MKKRAIVIIAAAVLLLLAVGAVRGIHSSRVSEAYERAEKLISDGDYAKAEELLAGIGYDYRDTEPLTALCRAHIEYAEGKIEDAYNTMYGVSFAYQSDEMNDEIESFRLKLRNAYKAYKQQAVQNITDTPAATPKPGSPPRSPAAYDEKPNVGEYSGPDEYYYWNADDFVDYEDAENYYYSNGGE